MKKIGLVLALVLVILLELFLASAFLPAQWQLAIRHELSRLLPHPYDHSVVTHPALDREIDQALEENLALRVGFYVLVVGLLVCNTVILIKIFKLMRPRSALFTEPTGPEGSP